MKCKTCGSEDITMEYGGDEEYKDVDYFVCRFCGSDGSEVSDYTPSECKRDD